MVSFSQDPIAYVSPPRVQDFQEYPQYLHAFTLFLDFLNRHPEVGNEQTKKRVKQPSMSSIERLASDVRSRLPGFAESVDSEWDDAQVREPVPIPYPRVATPHPVAQQDVKPCLPLDDKVAKVSKSPAVEAPLVSARVVDTKGACLLGKKKVKTLLRQFCDEELATHLVALDKISREPGVFERELDFLRRKSERHGGVLLGLNSAGADAFTVMGNGRTSVPDYMAMWNSSEGEI